MDPAPGKPVEERGRSIGAFVRRGILDSESNFCYGEGGAGTWSDGKLTTRIGRNSADVRAVLETLVRFGAPPRILVDGQPHLGTDNLVRLLKRFRAELLSLGAEILWDARVADLVLARGDAVDRPYVRGVRLADGSTRLADAVQIRTFRHIQNFVHKVFESQPTFLLLFHQSASFH